MIRERLKLMPVQQKVFIGIAIFSLLVAPLAFGGDNAILPDWGQTIPAGQMAALYFMPVWFFLISIIYKKLDRSTLIPGKMFFTVHLLITVIPLLYLCFFTYVYVASVDNIDADILLILLRVNERVWQVFLAAQVFFAMSLIFRLLLRQKKLESQ